MKVATAPSGVFVSWCVACNSARTFETQAEARAWVCACA